MREEAWGRTSVRARHEYEDIADFLTASNGCPTLRVTVRSASAVPYSPRTLESEVTGPEAYEQEIEVMVIVTTAKPPTSHEEIAEPPPLNH